MWYIYLSILAIDSHVHIYIHIYLSIQTLYIYIYTSISLYLSIYVSIHVYLSIYLSAARKGRPQQLCCLASARGDGRVDRSHIRIVYSACSISIDLSICRLIYLSIYLSLSIYLFISIHLSIYLSIYLHLSIYLAMYLHLSIYLSIYLQRGKGVSSGLAVSRLRTGAAG